jgi:hypothetical protein
MHGTLHCTADLARKIYDIMKGVVGHGELTLPYYPLFCEEHEKRRTKKSLKDRSCPLSVIVAAIHVESSCRLAPF